MSKLCFMFSIFSFLFLRVKRLIFDRCLLQVLPKPGQLIVQPQTAPPVAMQPERSNQEVSSGAGELSDSVSVAEVGVPKTRKKKSRVRKLLLLIV